MKFRLSLRGKKNRSDSIDGSPPPQTEVIGDSERPHDTQGTFQAPPPQSHTEARPLTKENPPSPHQKDKHPTRHRHPRHPHTNMDYLAQRPSTSRLRTSGPIREDDSDMATPGSPSSRNGPTSPVEEPVWKVAPAVFKKYGLQGEWQDHVMVLSYGPPEKRIERYLALDEQPLIQFTNLKNANQNPAFSFVKMSGIMSPVALAMRKYEARRAAGAVPLPKSRQSAESKIYHPDMAENGKRSRKALSGDAVSIGGSTVNSSMKSARLSGTTLNTYTSRDSRESWGSKHPSEVGSINSNTPSWAICVYPWMADYEDEFDAEVGDAFVVLSRSPKWWTCQRDDNGIFADEAVNKQGWVPSGSLLELNVPISTALAEARARNRSNKSLALLPRSRQPILPQNIATSFYPSIGLAPFSPREEEEIELRQDEIVRVYKRYNQWCYIVKDNGERGWVPGWLLGKNISP